MFLKLGMYAAKPLVQSADAVLHVTYILMQDSQCAYHLEHVVGAFFGSSVMFTGVLSRSLTHTTGDAGSHNTEHANNNGDEEWNY